MEWQGQATLAGSSPTLPSLQLDLICVLPAVFLVGTACPRVVRITRWVIGRRPRGTNRGIIDKALSSSAQLKSLSHAGVEDEGRAKGGHLDDTLSGAEK